MAVDTSGGAGEPAGTGDSHAVMAAIAALTERGARWFPHLDPAWTVQVAERMERSRCLLVRLRIFDGWQEASVVVKARRQGLAGRGAGESVSRPTLMPPEALPEAEMAQREFEWLSMISAGFGGTDGSRFGVAQPLAWLPEHAAFVMDHVADPTLRHRLMSRSRLRPNVGPSRAGCLEQRRRLAAGLPRITTGRTIAAPQRPAGWCGRTVRAYAEYSPARSGTPHSSRTWPASGRRKQLRCCPPSFRSSWARRFRLTEPLRVAQRPDHGHRSDAALVGTSV